MIFGKKIKRDTQLIIISVIVLTLVSLNVSYSAFFSVQSQSTIQEISTGTLNVIIDGSQAMGNGDLLPTAHEDLPKEEGSSVSGNYAILNISNTGTLDSDFSVTVSYDVTELPSNKDTNDLISFDYLSVGIYDIDNNKWINFGTDSNPVYYTPFKGLTPSEENVYPILRDTISSATDVDGTSTPTTRQYRVYIWLSEDTPISEIGKLVYLKLEVKSATVNGRVDS